MKIKEFRKYKNLTRKELANQLGISVNCLLKYENNINEPSIETLIKMSKIFNVSVDAIIENNREIVSYDMLTPSQKKCL